VLASDAHDVSSRPPRLSAGRDAAARIVGDEQAARLVSGTPLAITGG
jgi:protein-tyrosine phosphatase